MVDLPPVLEVQPGRLLARGREATVHEAGPGLVVRRYDDARDITVEVKVMQHVARYGIRVPAVHGVLLDGDGRPIAMVLDRVDGPTLVEAALRGRVGASEVGRMLALLHAELHGVPLEGLPPLGEPSVHEPGHVVMHLDLHPANVLLADDGPVLIDWAIARTGPATLDTAMTAMTLAAAVLAGVPRDAGDVAALEIPAAFVSAALDAYLHALPEPPTASLERAASVLDMMGAQPPDVVRAALALVLAALSR
jgi:aminoglycoside phosphotransferase (APT) family kinase protein